MSRDICFSDGDSMVSWIQWTPRYLFHWLNADFRRNIYMDINFLASIRVNIQCIDFNTVYVNVNRDWFISMDILLAESHYTQELSIYIHTSWIFVKFLLSS